MPAKRHLSLWFPRLAAERLLRLDRGLPSGPFVVVGDQRGAQVITSLNGEASAAGLIPGQPLGDARAMCPGLVSRPANPVAEAQFLTMLRRWAGKFSPWVSEEAPDGLVLDISGCAHLFGGEEALAEQVDRDCAALGLSVRLGLADTLGAAWALARFSHGMDAGDSRGDEIEQEARATRSRAVKRRHWTRGGTPPAVRTEALAPRIAAPGATRQAIGPLPLAALRLEADSIAGLNRLGLRRVEDLFGTPRAGLARRFGRGVVQTLDQALGVEPEPLSPARPAQSFAVRMGLPEPIGLHDDLLAGLDRLLPELESRLRRAGRGARRLRLELSRTDRTMQWIEIGLARPSADPSMIRPLLALRLDEVDAGFGIDQIRLVATVHEPVHAKQHAGHMEAAEVNRGRTGEGGIDALLARLGVRFGLEAITRCLPADSHIPEKTSLWVPVAFTEAPRGAWVRPERVRPLKLWAPEPVMIPDVPRLPETFRWRGRDHRVRHVTGPERIAPEWWLDDPAWRSGTRDYWEVVTHRGEKLWLFYAHGAAKSGGWFSHGAFA